MGKVVKEEHKKYFAYLKTFKVDVATRTKFPVEIEIHLHRLKRKIKH